MLVSCYSYVINYVYSYLHIALRMYVAAIISFKGCGQIGKALGVPPDAILAGLITLSSFFLSPAQVCVPTTSWTEPVLVWIVISMFTGSRKTTIYKFLARIIQDIKERLDIPRK